MEAQIFRYMFRDQVGQLLVRYRTNLNAALQSVPYRYRLKFTITKIQK